MQALIDVFRMEELSVTTRVKVLKQLGSLINCQYGANVTEELVDELVYILERL